MQSDGFSALHEAALYGHDDIARLLLRFGANKKLVNAVRRRFSLKQRPAEGLTVPTTRLSSTGGHYRIATRRAARQRRHHAHARRRTCS
jgi:ankyrin repeat protein